MQYFKQKKQTAGHQRKFFVPVELNAIDDDDLPDEDIPVYADEEAELQKDKLRILFGLGDFVGVVLGMVAVLALLAVLISLLNWVYADIVQTFDLWQPTL